MNDAQSSPRNGYKILRKSLHDAWRSTQMASRLSSMRYVSEALALKCAPDLLSQGLWPERSALKEITESFAAFNAVRRHIPWVDLKDRETTLVVIGDGATPRTAATFALRSAWDCHSIDPALSKKEFAIRRLTVHRSKASDVRIWAKQAIVVSVHSHASFEESVGCVEGAERMAYVAIPCCFAHTLAQRPPNVEYTDTGILAPDRRVYVWRAL